MEEDFIVNGLNGSTGRCLHPNSFDEVARTALGKEFSPDHLNDTLERYIRASQEPFRTKDWVENTNVDHAGWGVIFSKNVDPAVRDALDPLLKFRQQQAAKGDGRYYREFIGESAFIKGETKSDFLLGRGAEATGAVDPTRMPYYLLIVGNMDVIPYRFQYEMDVQYAIGRIHFDRPEDYANYARAVIEAETGGQRPRRATFFGVQNNGDRPTHLSTEYFIKPLAEKLSGAHGWAVDTILEDEATKARLSRLMGGDLSPTFLFTASHGMWFENDDPRKTDQGALVCRDWPGPALWDKPIPEDFYFAADDLTDDARLNGMISFHFACFSAGTPDTDDFPYQNRHGEAPAARSFLAKLPKKLLTHPKSGSLAFVGHVDRAWGCSFLDHTYTKKQVSVFQECITRLFKGESIGAALEPLNERYAELSVELANERQELRNRPDPPSKRLAHLWMANNDARNYIIIGDPAIKLNLQPV